MQPKVCDCCGYDQDLSIHKFITNAGPYEVIYCKKCADMNAMKFMEIRRLNKKAQLLNMIYMVD